MFNLEINLRLTTPVVELARSQSYQLHFTNYKRHNINTTPKTTATTTTTFTTHSTTSKETNNVLSTYYKGFETGQTTDMEITRLQKIIYLKFTSKKVDLAFLRSSSAQTIKVTV